MAVRGYPQRYMIGHISLLMTGTKYRSMAGSAATWPMYGTTGDKKKRAITRALRRWAVVPRRRFTYACAAAKNIKIATGFQTRYDAAADKPKRVRTPENKRNGFRKSP